MHTVTRRHWLQAAASASLAVPFLRAQSPEILGQGEFRYRQVPGWGVLDARTPVKKMPTASL